MVRSSLEKGDFFYQLYARLFFWLHPKFSKVSDITTLWNLKSTKFWLWNNNFVDVRVGFIKLWKLSSFRLHIGVINKSLVNFQASPLGIVGILLPSVLLCMLDEMKPGCCFTVDKKSTVVSTNSCCRSGSTEKIMITVTTFFWWQLRAF